MASRIATGVRSGNTIQVKGYQNVVRSFARVDKTVSRNLTKRLKDAAEPVREDAQERGPARIRNLKPSPTPMGRSDWARVRTGVTRRAAYIAPTERGVKVRGNDRLRRPNFKHLMLERAYEPALAVNRHEVIVRLGRIMDDINHAWRVG